MTRNYKPKTKDKPETKENIIKQNEEKYNKLIYDLTHNGILLSKIRESTSWKLGGKKLPKLGCVYRIICLSNNKIYVGSTNDFVSRFISHINKLKRNIHINPHLQNAYNLFGINNFMVTILEYIPYKENNYKEYKDYIAFLRKREQYYLDKLNCCDSRIGFNKSKKADTIYVETEKLFEDNNLKYSKDFILEICELMMNEQYNLREIAEMKGVKPSLIKDINQHRIYKQITEKYTFPERNNKKIWSQIHHKEDIYRLYHEGKTNKEIAEILKMKERDILHFLSFSPVPQPIYIYSITGELLHKFYMSKTCADFLNITNETLAHILTNSDKNNGKAFTQNEFDFIISRKSIRPNFTSLENYFGKYLNPTFKPIVKYDKDYKEIEEIYYNSKSVPGFKSTTINQYNKRKYNGWRNFKTTPQEDIEKFLIKKGIKIIENNDSN